MSKQRILIVDDDENIAELISLYLTKECFETSIVNDLDVPASAGYVLDRSVMIDGVLGLM